jgi:hypothetical protein
MYTAERTGVQSTLAQGPRTCHVMPCEKYAALKDALCTVLNSWHQHERPDKVSQISESTSLRCVINHWLLAGLAGLQPPHPAVSQLLQLCQHQPHLQLFYQPMAASNACVPRSSQLQSQRQLADERCHIHAADIHSSSKLPDISTADPLLPALGKSAPLIAVV